MDACSAHGPPLPSTKLYWSPPAARTAPSRNRAIPAWPVGPADASWSPSSAGLDHISLVTRIVIPSIITCATCRVPFFFLPGLTPVSRFAGPPGHTPCPVDRCPLSCPPARCLRGPAPLRFFPRPRTPRPFHLPTGPPLLPWHRHNTKRQTQTQTQIPGADIDTPTRSSPLPARPCQSMTSAHSAGLPRAPC